MKQLSRVVWNEGMHLAQHHFQAQSRYFEDTIQFALSSLFFAPYGLAGCELDAEAIRNDTISLVHARGVLPDGLPFDIPGSDAPPGSPRSRAVPQPRNRISFSSPSQRTGRTDPISLRTARRTEPMRAIAPNRRLCSMTRRGAMNAQ
jgi:predicted component of type VI protein secretion system